MAKGNFENCAIVTLAFEGGFTLDKRDPGNWTGGKVGVGQLKGTNMGIAANTFPNEDIKGMTKARAMELYRPRYWDGIKGELLPFGVDLVTYDYGVNSGPSRGIKALQKAVGAPVDGKAGHVTILKAQAAASDGKRIIQAICAGRLSFLRALPTWKTFKRGWSSRVATVEAKGVAMWLSHTGKSGAQVSGELKTEAAKADKTASTQSKAANGTTGAGASGGVADAVVNGGPNWWLIGGLVLAVVVVAGVLYLKSRHNKERAKAYEAVAA